MYLHDSERVISNSHFIIALLKSASLIDKVKEQTLINLTTRDNETFLKHTNFDSYLLTLIFCINKEP